jgi:SAM-dependent methyltransferase
MLRLESDTKWYVQGGLCALQNISESLAAVGRTFRDIDSCLDFPCGYGRVLRHLVSQISPSKISAGDADAQGVRFCAREFGVHPLYCDHDVARLSLPGSYDLIFVGSLFTHLDADTGLTLLRKLSAALREGGVLVFTTQGESCLNNLQWYGPQFEAASDTFRSGLRREGICFIPYALKRLASKQSPTDGRYGVTLHNAHYVRQTLRRVGLQVIRFVERGMEGHQDVWSAQSS